MNETPDTSISVLELFSTSKEGIISFSSKVINDVEDGKVSALRVKLLSKVLKEVAEKIDEGTKEKQLKEALLYGDKPFDYFGSEMHATATKTVYNYSNCNDPIYKELEQQAKELNDKIDERQKFLKAIKDSQTIITNEGEIVTVYPPIKRQWDGVKTTIK